MSEGPRLKLSLSFGTIPKMVQQLRLTPRLQQELDPKKFRSQIALPSAEDAEEDPA